MRPHRHDRCPVCRTARADRAILKAAARSLSEELVTLRSAAREVHRIDGWTPWASDRDALWALLWPGEVGTASVDSRSLPPEAVRPQETSEAHEAHDAAECERLRLELRAAQSEAEEAAAVLNAAERYAEACDAECALLQTASFAACMAAGAKASAAHAGLLAAVRARRAGA